MAHRRRARRFCFPQQLSPDETGALLKGLRAPRWMAARLTRAQSPAQISALTHPARWPDKRPPSAF